MLCYIIMYFHVLGADILVCMFNIQFIKNRNEVIKLINYIYSMYCMLYPENKLSYNTLYDNASVKKLINNYYNEK